MNLVELVSEHSQLLLAGSTAILAVFSLAVVLSRSPIHRQRLGELAIGAVLAWLVLFAVPLPRLLAPETGAPPRLAPAIVHMPSTDAARPEVARPIAAELPVLSPPSTRSNNAAPVLSRPEPERLALGLWLRLYLIGAAICAGYLALGLVLLVRIRALAVTPPAWLAADIAVLRPTLRVRLTALPCRPFTYGIVRPVVILPATLCRLPNREQVRQILRHEIAHVEQRDGLGQFLFALALPLLYFHPLYWWLRRRVRMAAEFVADDMAAGATSRACYARQLIRLAEGNLGHAALPAGAMTVFTTQSDFYRRMKMLLNRNESLPTRCSRGRRLLQSGLGVAIVGLTASIGGVRAAPMQETKAKTTKAFPVAGVVKIGGELLEYTSRPRPQTRKQLEQRIASLRKRIDELESQLNQRSHKPHPSKSPSAKVRAPKTGAPAPENDIVAHIDGVPVIDPRSPRLKAGKNAARTGSGDGAGSRMTAIAVVDLVSRAIDLDAAVKNAKLRLDRARPLAKKGYVGQSELRAAELAYENAARKRKLVRDVIESEIAASAAELDGLHRSYAARRKAGIELAGTKAAILRLQSRIRTLKSGL